jgi:hypothetical protein
MLGQTVQQNRLAVILLYSKNTTVPEPEIKGIPTAWNWASTFGPNFSSDLTTELVAEAFSPMVIF